MGISIVVCVRTRDEEHRIGQFCEAYKKADVILVADGGSIDKTKEIAATYPNVVVGDYPGRQPMENGMWRNNDADHANFLFRWAYSLKPDWIIYDDCDMIPNYLLKKHFRRILAKTTSDFVMVTKLYLWGTEFHCPNMAKPGANHDKYEPSLWAWRGNIDFWMVNKPPAYDFRIGDLAVKDLHFDAKALDLFPPYCCLHFSWDDPERVDRKVKMYRESGLIRTMQHPREFAGPIEPLPEWAHE